jgi:hypothetical protein
VPVRLPIELLGETPIHGVVEVGFDCAQGERSECGDARRALAHKPAQLAVIHNRAHESNPLRLLRREFFRQEIELARLGGADDARQS